MKLRSKMTKVDCPDGTFRFVYQNLDDAFKLELKDWSVGIRAKLKNWLLSALSTNAEFKKHVSGLLVDFDEVNRSLVAHFRALYSVYSSNPCDLDKWYAEQVPKLINTEFKIRLNRIKESTRLIENELAKHPTTPKNVLNIIAKAKRKLKQLSSNEKAKHEIQTALDDFHRWRNRR